MTAPDARLAAIRAHATDPSYGPVPTAEVAWLCDEAERLRERRDDLLAETVRRFRAGERHRARAEAAERALADLRAEVERLRELLGTCYSDECREPCQSQQRQARAELHEARAELAKVSTRLGEARRALADLRGRIEALARGLDAARADGTIYTYGQVQDRLRALLAGSGEAQIAYAERAGRVAAGLTPVAPDNAGLLADLVQAEADLDLIDPGEHGHTVALDADGQPDECVDDCPACAAERIRAVLAVVGQGVTAAEVRERLADAWDEGHHQGKHYWMLGRPNPYRAAVRSGEHEEWLTGGAS